MTQEEFENLLRQNAGKPIQQGAADAANAVENKLNQAGQAVLAMKQAALQRLTGPTPQISSSIPQQNPNIPEVLPNDPNMSAPDQQSRTNAMIAAPLRGGTSLDLDASMANRQKMVNMHNAASQEKANEWNDDTSDYSDVPKSNQTRQFPHIQAKIKSGTPINTQDIRATLKGPQEVTPELEKQLGYSSQDDEDDDKNTRGSTTDTGTLGGI